jgi:hypothetical protein
VGSLMLRPHTHSMKHLYRTAETSDGQRSPDWRAWRGLLFVEAGRPLARAGRLFSSPRIRRLSAYVLLLVGLVVQGVIILTAMYLVDLSISLMELWAELARQHLRITL